MSKELMEAMRLFGKNSRELNRAIALSGGASNSVEAYMDKPLEEFLSALAANGVTITAKSNVLAVDEQKK